jgi:hypothetical protein
VGDMGSSGDRVLTALANALADEVEADDTILTMSIDFQVRDAGTDRRIYLTWFAC